MGHRHFLNSTRRHEYFLNSTGRHEHFLNSTGRHLGFLKSTCKIRTPPPPPVKGLYTVVSGRRGSRGGGGVVIGKWRVVLMISAVGDRWFGCLSIVDCVFGFCHLHYPHTTPILPPMRACPNPHARFHSVPKPYTPPWRNVKASNHGGIEVPPTVGLARRITFKAYTE